MNDRPRAGRPPLDPEARLSRSLITRVTPATAGTFRLWQRDLNLSEAELLRALVLHGLEDLGKGWRPGAGLT